MTRCSWILSAILLSAIGVKGQGIEIPTEGHPSRGPVSAPVTIVEFGDFECPHCGGMYATLKLVQENYPDRVRLVFRQLPLRSIHPHAEKAAEASLCAFDQDQFWAYHDSLFENQAALDHSALIARAEELGLDTSRFETCLDSGEKQEAVDQDVQAAIDAGVYSTPTLYINGEMLTGDWPYRDVARMIDAALFRKLGEDLESQEDAFEQELSP